MTGISDLRLPTTVQLLSAVYQALNNKAAMRKYDVNGWRDDGSPLMGQQIVTDMDSQGFDMHC